MFVRILHVSNDGRVLCREECEKKQVMINEALDARLTNIANQETTHGEVIAKGKLDLYNTELRDSHMAALAETLIAFPIARTVRASYFICGRFVSEWANGTLGFMTTSCAGRFD